MPHTISASSFRSLLRCPHALFLDLHGDPARRSALSEFAEYLLDEGRRFEQRVLADRQYTQPQYPAGDLDAGCHATLRAMQAGEPLIYQGVLKSGRFVGIPDLLVRRQGRSAFGDWYYAPEEIKVARSVKDYHRLQLCFYAMLLEIIQARRPQSATITLADQQSESVDLVQFWPTFEHYLAAAQAIADRRTVTDLAIFSKCDECVWQELCAAEAAQRDDVTLVADLKRNTKPLLQELGIETVGDLAGAEAHTLASVRGIGAASAQRLILQARAQASGAVIAIRAPHLPASSVEVYYDIESEPNLDVDYLHGLLLAEDGQEPQYTSFVAENPQDEEDAFTRFVTAVAAILERHPQAPIYHYHWYERTHVRRLFDKYPQHSMTSEHLLGRFVDLHHILKEHFVLPVESYGLKAVSRWLGFCYRNTQSSAAQSMVWYRLWLDVGERKYLEDSVLYNEDDTRATLLIKNWIGSRQAAQES